MGNTSWRFFISFFTAFLWLIVFINFLGWSGGYINLATGSDVDWSNSYFGFKSVSMMIQVLDQTFNTIPFYSVDKLIPHMQDVLDTITFTIPKFIQDSANNGANILDVVKLIVNILFQPLILLAQLLILLGHLLWYVLCFAGVLFLALGGQFNIPMSNPPSPTIIHGIVSNLAFGC